MAPAPLPPALPPLDRLSGLLERFRVRAHLLHTGPLCGVSHFGAAEGRGFLHVLRRGQMQVTHPARSGAPRRLAIAEPTLLFYPRPLAHDFHNAPAEGSDFVCATLDFAGGAQHPLARALPPLVALPLREVPGLAHTLALLFDEAEAVRCGQRLLADRLFEVLLIQLLRWMLDRPAAVGLPPGLFLGLADARLARALVAVHEAPGEPWTLARMAQQAGLSRSAFAAAFRQAVGQPPADYLADWRCTLAQTGLREGRSVKQLAAELGYADASALSRAFRQRMGASVRDWLAAQRAGA